MGSFSLVHWLIVIGIAVLLFGGRGKLSSIMGDFAKGIKAFKSGMKEDDKMYHHYTGYPGGLRSETLRKRFARKPESVVEAAVRGMLPKNKLGRAMAGKLKVYRGD